VGQRSNTETIVAILMAFIDQKTWKQADLARHIGIQAATLHKHLEELRSKQFPLESERDHPHVYWSLPKTWYPGGVLLTNEQVIEVFRQLSRIPKGKARDRLLESLLRFLPAPGAPVVQGAVIPAKTSEREEHHLPVIEDAANQKVALQFRYITVTRGKEGLRAASVHRVLIGPPARFVATCHRSGSMKWFRVESVTDARLDPKEPFRDADEKAVDAHLRASLDGFHEGGPPVKHGFFVSDPDARWVARNLMDGMETEDVPGGIRVTIETSAPKRLARFVVGLGTAAKPLTPGLEREVVALAEGVLGAIRGGGGSPTVGSSGGTR
jgi:predicted DNA-binding transcriptional regulator YafY